jgi:hypothetical protein
VSLAKQRAKGERERERHERRNREGEKRITMDKFSFWLKAQEK